jgi:hypothetical protein
MTIINYQLQISNSTEFKILLTFELSLNIINTLFFRLTTKFIASKLPPNNYRSN